MDRAQEGQLGNMELTGELAAQIRGDGVQVGEVVVAEDLMEF